MIDLRSVIDSFGAPLVIQRSGLGVWTDGIYTPAPSNAVTVFASVQPTNRQERAIPEGISIEDTLTIYSRGLLRTGSEPDGYAADRFAYNGLSYEVISVRDWSVGSQGLYYKALAARIRIPSEDQL